MIPFGSVPFRLVRFGVSPFPSRVSFLSVILLCSSVWFGLVRFRSARFSSVPPSSFLYHFVSRVSFVAGVAVSGLVRFGLARFDSVPVPFFLFVARIVSSRPASPRLVFDSAV